MHAFPKAIMRNQVQTERPRPSASVFLEPPVDLGAQLMDRATTAEGDDARKISLPPASVYLLIELA